MLAGATPIFQQFRLVHRRPFKNQTLCSPWQLTLEYSNRVDTNEGSVPTVDGVEVRWIMIEVKHSDHDPVEFGYSWHVLPLPRESTDVTPYMYIPPFTLKTWPVI